MIVLILEFVLQILAYLIVPGQGELLILLQEKNTPIKSRLCGLSHPFKISLKVYSGILGVWGNLTKLRALQI